MKGTDMLLGCHLAAHTTQPWAMSPNVNCLLQLFIIDDAHIFIIDTVCHWSTCFVMLGANIHDSALFAGLELELVARVV
jgi:hypothetical protein